MAKAARVEVHSGLLSALYATPEHSSRAGYRISIWYDNSGLGWQNFEQAWSFGKQYPFVSTNREVGSCAGGSCITIEEGYILMSDADFKKAAKSGFTFKLIGKGSVEGTIPASAFQQVLALLGK